MKKYLLFILLQVCLIPFAAADGLTSAQLKLRSEINAFLKEEGFMPEIDTDGDICFKKEGKTYYVSINQNDESPMYISFFREFSYPEEYSQDVIVMACKKLNMYKGVKVLCAESSFRITCEMYLVSSEAFKYAFYKLMSQIANVQDDFLDECEIVSNIGKGEVPSSVPSLIPFVITNLEVANADKDGNIIQDYGTQIYDFKSQYLQPRISIIPLVPSGTYTVYIKLYQNDVLSTSQSSPKDYTYSQQVTITSKENKTITLSGWEQSVAGNWSEGQYRFEFWINDYCIGSKTFKII